MDCQSLHNFLDKAQGSLKPQSPDMPFDLQTIRREMEASGWRYSDRRQCHSAGANVTMLWIITLLLLIFLAISVSQGK
jgi:hypothetical protein